MTQYIVCLNEAVSENNRVALRSLIKKHWGEFNGLTPDVRYRADAPIYVSTSSMSALQLKMKIAEELNIDTYISVLK